MVLSACIKYLFGTLLVASPLLSISQGPLEHAIVAIYAVHSNTGEVLIDQNSEMSMIPASCLKIVTTAAALHVLGAECCFETTLEYDGFIDAAHTLHGNLYIRGGGDPCLGSDRISGSLSWKKQINAWVKAVHDLSIKKILGKIIGDASKWETALAVPSWTWEDLGNYYGAGASALSFNENMYSLFLKPGNNVGDNVTILRTDPPLSIHFFNELKTGPAGSGDHAWIFGSEGTPFHTLRGTIPAGVSEFKIKGALPNPAEISETLLAQELERTEIAIGRQDIPQTDEHIVIHRHFSPTVKEIVYWTNQRSINLYAEHLLKQLGERTCKEGSTEAGIRAVTHFMKSRNIDLGGFHMADGSGLSRKNLLTARQLVAVLLQMKKSEHFPVFLESLPQIEHSIRAKSGTMSLINGYAGYAGDIAFAILVNQCSDSKAMDEKIAATLALLNRRLIP